MLGPRLLAGGRDIGSTGSNADLHPDYAQLKIDGLGMITDGPWEVRKAVRTLSKNGVDVVKVMIDGELISQAAESNPGCSASLTKSSTCWSRRHIIGACALRAMHDLRRR